MALKVAVSGIPDFLLVNVYLQAAVGLNQLNKTILATVAMWQEEARLPVLAGGDFNIPAARLQASDYVVGSGMEIIAPREPTYRTTKSRSTIDYYLVPKGLGEQVQSCHTLSVFPLRPHSPV